MRGEVPICVRAERGRAVSALDRAERRPIDRNRSANDQIVTASRLQVLWRPSRDTHTHIRRTCDISARSLWPEC